MKATKIPRKLKNALKKAYLKNSNPAWKTKHVRILGIKKKRSSHDIASVGNISISSCTLG